MEPTITDEYSGVVVSNPEYVARQKGIKEVVEWINVTMFGNSEGYIFGSDPTFSIEVFHKALRSQLKEWGFER